jgi:hypothetical protein
MWPVCDAACKVEYSDCLQDAATEQAWQQAAATVEMQRLADELVSFAAVLCAAAPSKLCCNEPSCLNMAGFSELDLAKGEQHLQRPQDSSLLQRSVPAQALEGAQGCVQGPGSSTHAEGVLGLRGHAACSVCDDGRLCCFGGSLVDS